MQDFDLLADPEAKKGPGPETDPLSDLLERRYDAEFARRKVPLGARVAAALEDYHIQRLLPTPAEIDAAITRAAARFTQTILQSKEPVLRAVQGADERKAELHAFRETQGLDRAAIPPTPLKSLFLRVAPYFAGETALNAVLIGTSHPGGLLAGIVFAVGIAGVNAALASTAGIALRRIEKRSRRLIVATLAAAGVLVFNVAIALWRLALEREMAGEVDAMSTLASLLLLLIGLVAAKVYFSAAHEADDPHPGYGQRSRDAERATGQSDAKRGTLVQSLDQVATDAKREVLAIVHRGVEQFRTCERRVHEIERAHEELAVAHVELDVLAQADILSSLAAPRQMSLRNGALSGDDRAALKKDLAAANDEVRALIVYAHTSWAAFQRDVEKRTLAFAQYLHAARTNGTDLPRRRP